MKDQADFKLKNDNLITLIEVQIQKVNLKKVKPELIQNNKILTIIYNTHLYMYRDCKVSINLKVNEGLWKPIMKPSIIINLPGSSS